MMISNCRCLQGRCHSGPKTLSEDGPDVEGIRAAYKLLTSEFTREQLSVGIYHNCLNSKRAAHLNIIFNHFLQELEYPDLEITREQSFFYSVAMRSCRDISKAVCPFFLTHVVAVFVSRCCFPHSKQHLYRNTGSTRPTTFE